MLCIVKVFAHRGASTQYAEHTRAAFLHALTVGAHGIETDVQLTADGHLVCWHDATLNRTSNGRGPVQSHTLAELRNLDVHTWKSRGKALPSNYGGPRDQLVTLDELTQLAITAGRPVELAVELKSTPENSGGLEDAVLAWLDRWGWEAVTSTLRPDGHASQVSVSLMSFARTALNRLGTVVPSRYLCPLFLPGDGHQFTLGIATESGPMDLLGPSTAWLSRYESVLREWTGAGRTVRMWTIETELQLRFARQFGIQQVTVDDPAWALDRVPSLV